MRRTPVSQRCWRPHRPSRYRHRDRTRLRKCRQRWQTARESSSRWQGKSPRRRRCWCSAACIWCRAPVTGSRCRRTPSGWSNRNRRVRGVPPLPDDAGRTWTPPEIPWSNAPNSSLRCLAPRTGADSNGECRSKLSHSLRILCGSKLQADFHLIEHARRL